MKFCPISLLSFVVAITAEPLSDVVPNPQQLPENEFPCLAECIVTEDGNEICTFQVSRDELASELGYYKFTGVGDEDCGGANPVLGIKKGATYLFTQRRTSNYYHPIGFAHGPDGALDEQPELEPGICFGQQRDEPELDCDCKKPADGTEFGEGEVGSCPAPMYFRGNEYLGKYSNNAVVAPLSMNEDFGLDAYEPEFVIPLLQWKTAAKGVLFEQERENYFVALNIPTDIESNDDFFYFCHVHQFMTGRIKFVGEDGRALIPQNTKIIPYEYQQPDEYDLSCGTIGISSSRLPNDQCPETFVCNRPDAITKPKENKFADCVDSMNCAMIKGMTTMVNMQSSIALFNHQMIPHHQQAVNMCKALDVAGGTECDDIVVDEDEPKCILKVLCQEIINVQNAQIQTMRGVLAQLNLKESDDCIVEIKNDDSDDSSSSSSDSSSKKNSKTKTRKGGKKDKRS